MARKNSKKLIVILIMVLTVGFFYYINIDRELSGLKIHYYKDGVEIFMGNSLSVISVDTSSYNEISLEIIGENTGNYPINNMLVDSAGPIQFKDSLPTLSKSLATGETKTLWISDRIDVHQFEALPQPVKFWVNISGESPYISGKIYDYIELELDIKSPKLIGPIYQENADEISCSGWGSCSRAYDGNWNTYATLNTGSNIFVSYIIPDGATSATFISKIEGSAVREDSTTERFFALESCWNYARSNSNILKFKISSFSNGIDIRCWRGYWGQMRNCNNCNRLYEEAVRWEIS